MTHTQTRYRRIGGRGALTAVVDEFYRRLLADPEVAPLFADTDMDRQRRHQAAFLATALGGPAAYAGRDMHSAHRGRGITARHFAVVAGHLQTTLEWAGVGGDELAAIMATAAGLQEQIVER